MIQNWHITHVAVAPLHIIDGDRGKNYPKHADFGDAGHCLFLNTGNVTKQGFNFDQCQFITEEKDGALNKGKLQRGDIIMTTRGTIGNVAHYIPAVPFEHVRINSGMVIFRTNREALLDRFLFQYLRSGSFRKQIESLRTGAAQPQLPIRDIKTIGVPIPAITIQRRIADILSAYDDLIENNRRRIALLEQAARELYREWFVRLRFPGHENTRIADGLPEGWKRKTLGELAYVTMGQSPKSTHYNETGDGLPFHQGVTNFGYRFPAHRTYCSLETRVAVPRDILFSVRAPVGRINITLDKIVIGRGIAAIRSVQDEQNFLFYALKNHFFREDMIGGGAIFAAVTKKELHGVQIMQASSNVIQMFSDCIRSVDSQIEGLHLMAEQLMCARDLLLPRLMSGEVTV